MPKDNMPDNATPQEDNVGSSIDLDSILKNETAQHDDHGIQAVIDRALLSYERLPMLEVVFDRLGRNLSSALRNLTSESADVTIRAINSMRYHDYIDLIPPVALQAIFKVLEWDNYGIVYADNNLVYSFVEVLFGGRRIGQNNNIKNEIKQYTVIEQNIFKQFVETMLTELSTAFEPLSPATFVFERIETNPLFASVARSGDAVILLNLEINIAERAGNAYVMLPYNTLESVRELLTQVFVGDKFIKDSSWSSYVAEEINNFTLKLDAYLGEKELTLYDIMKFKVGTTVILDVHQNDDIEIRCADIKMLSAKIGGVGENVAVSVTGALNSDLKGIVT